MNERALSFPQDLPFHTTPRICLGNNLNQEVPIVQTFQNYLEVPLLLLLQENFTRHFADLRQQNAEEFMVRTIRTSGANSAGGRRHAPVSKHTLKVLPKVFLYFLSLMLWVPITPFALFQSIGYQTTSVSASYSKTPYKFRNQTSVFQRSCYNPLEKFSLF